MGEGEVPVCSYFDLADGPALLYLNLLRYHILLIGCADKWGV